MTNFLKRRRSFLRHLPRETRLFYDDLQCGINRIYFNGTMRLKTKIITYISAVLILLVFAIAYMIFAVIQPKRLEKLMEATMLKVAGSIAYELGSDLQTNDSERFARVARRLLLLEDVYGVSVYNERGQLYFSSQFKTTPTAKLEPAIYQRVFMEKTPHFQPETIDHRRVLTLFSPIVLEQNTIGVLRLTFTFDSLQKYRYESLGASLLACMLGLAVMVALVYWMLSALFARIRAVITNMNTIIRENDLTQRVLVESPDEIGELGQVFNRMVEGLVRLAKEIQDAGAQVSTSTEKIVHVAKSQLETAEELMFSVEEAQIGVEELEKLADHISEKSGTVLTDAEYTLTRTIRGVEVVEALVSDMNDVNEISRQGVDQIIVLNQKARQITDIVTIIEDITANTKLIAFNATIEAARAGDAGRGFSVVAHEIRNLADSVSVATGSIRRIVQDMQDATALSSKIAANEREKVEHGMGSVQRTNEHLDMVLTMLKNTVLHAREISNATEEQQASNVRIVKKMQKFFEIAQSAKSSTAHTNSSARELNRLSEKMLAAVERFKVQ